MPCVGLRTEDGKFRKVWQEIDPSVDWKLFYPSTAGLLQWMKADQMTGRVDVDPTHVSASEIAYDARRLWLASTQPYYTTVRQLIGAAMGTKAHDIIEKGAKPNQICELRLTIGSLTAKNDLYDIPSRTLEDLKHIGWYALKKIITNGVNDPDGGRHYVLQMNLWRVMASLPLGLEQIRQRHPEVTAEDMAIRDMKLTVIPRDLTGSNKKEAMGTKGLTNPWCVPITVPLLDPKEVIGEYMKLADAKRKAVKVDDAPICAPDKRWDRGKDGYPAMCVEYCPVIENCLSQARAMHGDNFHPVDQWAWKKFKRPHVLEVK